MSSSEGRTRREILADTAKLAAAASLSGLAGCFPGVGGSWPLCKESDGGANGYAGVPPRVTPAVVEVNRPESVIKYVIQPDVVASMLDAGLAALANQVKLFNAGGAAQDGGADTAEAEAPESDGGTGNPWTVLLPNYKAGQSIGLKVNCLNPFGVTTSPALIRAIVASLHDNLGVDPGNIFVWDRFLTDLENNGKLSSDAVGGAKLIGTLLRGLNSGESEDDSNITAGHGFGDPICSAPIGVAMSGQTARYPRLSRILTKETALTISCPVFKSHNISGVSGAMKNIYGMIDNPEQYHQPNLFTDLPKLYALPDIRNRVSLIICDALVGILLGDPAARANCQPGRILLAQDPVAIDSYVRDAMDEIQASQHMGSVDRTATTWLENAEAAGLGTTKYSLYQA
jgi:uncharacterized protein (DUF362 family)